MQSPKERDVAMHAKLRADMRAIAREYSDILSPEDWILAVQALVDASDLSTSAKDGLGRALQLELARNTARIRRNASRLP